ncbi:hypothetical protein SLEP1_g51168 [Rubroshorea leprosula]|uniref:Uncharacterized protein n=1 Tax=Rubroshorea leprosula TaxID=152421 RepID=A0AAV5M3T8_9ROSI|nr:hypothetical protein SLEP1_g51168 [Rubroshorea leprosula]
METAICGRLPLSPNTVFNPKPDYCKAVWIDLMIMLRLSCLLAGFGKGRNCSGFFWDKGKSFSFEQLLKKDCRLLIGDS